MSTQLSSFSALPDLRPDEPLSRQSENLRIGLQKLSRRTQQVFLLSRLDGLTYAAIAGFLNMAPDSVERAMVRALQQSRRHGTAPIDPIAESAHEAASRWYVHLQSPQATASQRIEFRHWLDASLDHLHAFEATERLWRQLQAPASAMGSSGWHRRKRRAFLGWWLLCTFVSGLLVAAEAFS
ncbi:sigma factor-like helix-turn-helix DNA-binding protein [Pseudomonas sp. DWP3-1-2]|uniref:sigma factor-like helix-turn-helix DNA-binding protein n=1 Tax=Pseudomonas sp. DWP3-1-2 TaxID=2804645 RepID=UPI003CF21B3D